MRLPADSVAVARASVVPHLIVIFRPNAVVLRAAILLRAATTPLTVTNLPNAIAIAPLIVIPPVAAALPPATSLPETQLLLASVRPIAGRSLWIHLTLLEPMVSEADDTRRNGPKSSS